MRSYAENTSVSAERSRGEIEALLRKYGAGRFGYLWEGKSAAIVFEMKNRRVKFVLPLPDPADNQFHQTPKGRWLKNPAAANEKWEQACRSRWRSLVLCIKAKLESVASEIETFEEAFLPHIVLPDGSTVGEFIIPQVGDAYSSKKMPPLLMSAK